MHRPLGSLEHCVWLLNRSVGNQVVYAAEIDGVASPDAWRAAFDAVQRRHPLLRVRVPATVDGWPYFETVNDQPIPLRFATEAVWDAGGIAPDWLDDALARELDEPIDADVAPLARAVIASCRDKSVVILSGAHVIVDGLSLSYCMGDLLKSLNGEHLDVLPFPPSLDQLLDEASATPHAKVSLDPVCFPRDPPGGVCHLKLPRELTGRLVQRARDEGTSMHSTLCCALLVVGRSVLPKWCYEPVRIFSGVDMRQQFGIAGDCGIFVTNAMATLEPSLEGSFWEMARGIMLRTDAAAARAAAPAFTRYLRDLLANGMDAAHAIWIRQTSITHDLVVTNIGPVRFATPPGPFKMTALWGPLARSGYPGDYTVCVTTVEGCANLTLMCPDAPLPATFLDETRALLAQACET